MSHPTASACVKADSPSIPLDDIYSVKAFKERYAQLFRSTTELDYLLRNRETNGLADSGAVISSSTGRRVSIVGTRFASWFVGELENG